MVNIATNFRPTSGFFSLFGTPSGGETLFGETHTLLGVFVAAEQQLLRTTSTSFWFHVSLGKKTKLFASRAEKKPVIKLTRTIYQNMQLSKKVKFIYLAPFIHRISQSASQ